MFGDCAAMKSVQQQLARIAGHDCHVLITGETGTGKELAARAIHDLSSRRRGAFVAVNCAAIPDALIEGELFGHERGAYTGAVQSFPGRLKLAEGGSILLDEIGEMNPAIQAKLLRVIENREVWPVGGRKEVHVDVRFIAATNRDVEERIEDNRFRPDLYYRLNVGRIHLPALRERLDDVPLLLRRFVGEFASRFRRHVEGFHPEVVSLLMKYRWPGNVRELKNLVEATFVNSDASLFHLADLPEPWPKRLVAGAPQPADERTMLLATLAETLGNRAQAAKALQCSRMTLYRKLKKYDLQADLRRLRTAGH